MKHQNISLYSTKADEILDQFPDLDPQERENTNLFPNLPIVRDATKDFTVKSNIFWILTKNIPDDVFTMLLFKDLVPYYGAGDTYEYFEKIYYGKN